MTGEYQSGAISALLKNDSLAFRLLFESGVTSPQILLTLILWVRKENLFITYIRYQPSPQIEVPANTINHGAKRPSVVTLMGGQATSSGTASGSAVQVKSVYNMGSGMGFVPGGNAALTNASLVELGKQLLSASREGDKAEVSRLLAKGAPMTTDWLGTSPLHLAAQYGHLETAEILLRSGCQRDARTKVEKTPLHVAAQEGHDNIAELLLSNGADVDTTDMVK